MKILSLGGPTFGKAAGNIGVSGAILAIMRCEGAGCQWLHLNGHTFRTTKGTPESTFDIGSFSETDKRGHYHHCRSKLWAILHELPGHLESHAADERNWKHYKQLQQDLVRIVQEKEWSDEFFIQDYDFALVPSMLLAIGVQSRFFLHNPWPQHVPADYVKHTAEMAKGMLGSYLIGFHTRRYAAAFCRFVNKHLSGYRGDAHDLVIRAPGGRIIRLVVAPLGLDTDAWREAGKAVFARAGEINHLLAIARPDPAKAMPELIEEWGLFQERYPELGHNSVLSMVIASSSSDVPAFVKERALIASKVERVSGLFPGSINWIQTAKGRTELAKMYRMTRVFLAPSFADGLGLVGLEHALCSDPEEGHVLAMSDGCGAFSLVGRHVVKLQPRKVGQMADAIAEALRLVGTPTAVDRMRAIQASIPDIGDWYGSMSMPTVVPQPARKEVHSYA